jgi:16S rRNA A1518/A1519 N6-dimethyltransferase RsmA/KsgA/DIM1 with predicted DNA glycosylase/AP lyase activity
LLKTAFSQRRKKLLGVLRQAAGADRAGDPFSRDALAGIDLHRRPEQLALSDWFALYGGWVELKGDR